MRRLLEEWPLPVPFRQIISTWRLAQHCQLFLTSQIILINDDLVQGQGLLPKLVVFLVHLLDEVPTLSRGQLNIPFIVFLESRIG